MGILLANPLIIVGSTLTLFFGCSVIEVVKYFYLGHSDFSCFFSIITAIPNFIKGFIGGFSHLFFKSKPSKETFALTQAMIEAVKQQSPENWKTLLCVKSIDCKLREWEYSLGSTLNHLVSLNKAFQPLPQAETFEVANNYYDSIGDPHKEAKLEVLANLYTPLKYKDIFSLDNSNQNVDDFQLVLEIFARRLKACGIYNKKWVFGKAPILFSEIYGDIVNRDYLALVLKNEIIELEKCVDYHKNATINDITPVGIFKENPDVLFFRATPIRRRLILSAASQKLAYLQSMGDLNSKIQALVHYEQDRPFWEDFRRLWIERHMLIFNELVLQIQIEPEVELQEILSEDNYDALVKSSKVLSLRK